VDSFTLGWLLITRDTVWYETEAAAATSRMLTGRGWRADPDSLAVGEAVAVAALSAASPAGGRPLV
jgi:hypothetical protein